MNKLVGEIHPKQFSKRQKAGVYLMGGGGMLLVISLRELLEIPKIEGVGLHLGVLTIAAVLTIVLHEGLHGLFLWIFSKKVQFGATLKSSYGPIFYATSRGSLIPRIKFQTTMLAPQILTILPLLALALATLPDTLANGLLVVAALNLGGSCIDIWGFFLLQKYPRTVLVEDTEDGCKIYEN